jgi:hypothetical protein
MMMVSDVSHDCTFAFPTGYRLSPRYWKVHGRSMQNLMHYVTEPHLSRVFRLDFSGGVDELVSSVYLSSELMVIDTQTVDGPGVL